MYYWKVILEHNEKIIESIIEAGSYADAYIKAQLQYSGCRLLSIKQFEPETKQNNKDTDKK